MLCHSTAPQPKYIVSNRGHLALVHPVATVDADLSPANRRAHERLTLSALSWLGGARLKYGPSVSLIDLSVGGAQIETSNHRLDPGSTVVIEFSSDKEQFVIPSRVVRARVSGLVPHTTYLGALEFRRPFQMAERGAVLRMPALESSPIQEHARLVTALERLGTAKGTTGAVITAGHGALTASLELIESMPGRVGTPLAREMSRLLRSITRSIEAGEPAAKLLADMTDALRRAVPAKTIKLVDGVMPARLHSPDAVTFDVPATPGRATKLLVEFPHGCQLEHWHFQLLKTAAHMVALANEIERAQQQQASEDRQQRDEYFGWHRLVVRYNDGRVLKGLGRDFVPGKGHVQVWPAIDAPPESRITVPLGHLKAVFFVHDFQGGVDFEGQPAVVAAGRRIIVTFLDGEALEGLTLNYATEGPGFFVTPLEAGNNQRIFVVSGAVRHVIFP